MSGEAQAIDYVRGCILTALAHSPRTDFTVKDMAETFHTTERTVLAAINGCEELGVETPEDLPIGKLLVRNTANLER